MSPDPEYTARQIALMMAQRRVGEVPIVIPSIDWPAIIAGWQRAARQIGAALQRFVESMTLVRRGLRPFTRAEAIRRHGPRNLAGDDTWQCDLCAAWLHGSCPVPEFCDCTCNGGPVR